MAQVGSFGQLLKALLEKPELLKLFLGVSAEQITILKNGTPAEIEAAFKTENPGVVKGSDDWIRIDSYVTKRSAP
jgi:hypothetical protein